MALKVIGGLALILVLALVGTAGVAYYNDPTVFDQCGDHGSCPSSKTSCNSVEPSCSDSEPQGCCIFGSDSKAPEAEASSK